MKYILLLLSLSLAFQGLSQDRIHLMNGKWIDGEIIDASSEIVRLTHKVKGKVQEDEIAHYRIYQLEYADGKTVPYYQQDTLVGHKFTFEEMGYFIEGEKLATKQTSLGPIIYGVGIGIIGGIILPPIVAVPAPVVVAFSTLIPKINIDQNKLSNKKILKEPAFVKGYHRVIKSRRMNRTLIAGFGGVAIGIGTNILLGL